MIKRVIAIVVSSFVLMACGPGAKLDGKQGAAEALFAASQPTAKANSAAQPADSLSISYSCPQGGNASITAASLNLGGGSVSTAFKLGYDSCGLAKNDVGVAVFNGDLNFTQAIDVNAGVSLEQKFTGKVLVQGAYDDFIDADVTQTVNVSDLSSGTGAVSMTLKGTISTSEGTYTYDEAVTVTPGSISAHLKSN